MNLSYDKETDSLYIHLSNMPSVDSNEEVADGVAPDFDGNNGVLAGIDVQHASQKTYILLYPPLLLTGLQAFLSKHWVALLFMLLCNNVAYAWNVTVQADAPSASATVRLENDAALSNVDVYLTWLDLDDKTETAYRSWLPALGWRTGLMPGMTGKNLAPFSAQPVTALPAECPAQHRCFLAWVATPTGAAPLDWRRWRASTLLPLNAIL